MVGLETPLLGPWWGVDTLIQRLLLLTATEEAGLWALAVGVAWAWIRALEWALPCMRSLLQACPAKRTTAWGAAPFLDAGTFGERYVQSGHIDYEGLVHTRWRRKWQPTQYLCLEKSHFPGGLQTMGSQRVGHD